MKELVYFRLKEIHFQQNFLLKWYVEQTEDALLNNQLKKVILSIEYGNNKYHRKLIYYKKCMTGRDNGSHIPTRWICVISVDRNNWSFLEALDQNLCYSRNHRKRSESDEGWRTPLSMSATWKVPKFWNMNVFQYMKDEHSVCQHPVAHL